MDIFHTFLIVWLESLIFYTIIIWYNQINIVHIPIYIFIRVTGFSCILLECIFCCAIYMKKKVKRTHIKYCITSTLMQIFIEHFVENIIIMVFINDNILYTYLFIMYIYLYYYLNYIKNMHSNKTMVTMHILIILML